MTKPDPSFDAIVVGGGMTGVVCAAALDAAPFIATLTIQGS